MPINTNFIGPLLQSLNHKHLISLCSDQIKVQAGLNTEAEDLQARKTQKETEIQAIRSHEVTMQPLEETKRPWDIFHHPTTLRVEAEQELREIKVKLVWNMEQQNQVRATYGVVQAYMEATRFHA